jgi:sec-independent protein translocase protein TatB
MFDIAFSELLVIGIVALIVIGPERLPKLARTAGQWLGRLNRYVAQVKQDIDRDMKLEELRRLQQEMKETAQRYEILADETRREIEEETDQVKRVVAAMSTTDDGLAQKAYEALLAEQSGKSTATDAPAASAQPPSTQPAALAQTPANQPAAAPDKQDRPG